MFAHIGTFPGKNPAINASIVHIIWLNTLDSPCIVSKFKS